MNSQITEAFIEHFRRLPDPIKELARKSYGLWRDNPAHPSLHFKRVHRTEPIYSARVGRSYRVLGLLEEDTITWFWIGDHDEYERLIASL